MECITIGFLTCSYLKHVEFNDKLDEYNHTRNRYLSYGGDYLKMPENVPTVIVKELIQLRKQMEEEYNEVHKTQQFRDILLSVSIASYLLNILDVLIFHSHKDIIVPIDKTNSMNIKPVMQQKGDTIRLVISFSTK